MKNPMAALVLLPIAAMLCACSRERPAEPAVRAVRVVELQYGNVHDLNRYAGTVQSRYEVEQAFRVGGKVVQRKVDVGQVVHEGDVLAVLDDADYRLAEEASRQAWTAAVAQDHQADADRRRLSALKTDGSVSVSDDERATTGAQAAHAAAEAEAKKLDLARNRLNYTVLRASRSGVVTAVRLEVGQVVPEGLPVVAIADPGAPEIVIDVPEDQVAAFKSAHFKATLAGTPNESFEVALRELSPQAAALTRTYRAKLKPVTARALPLGATATLQADRVAGGEPVAAVPTSALTQANGRPAVWVVRRSGQEPVGVVELVPVEIKGYRNDDVLLAGSPAGQLVVTAGVQKMAPGMKVLVPASQKVAAQ